ncbi:iron export ABC transporter permease subunit FetB [Clostridium sporogenes]|uniref:Iron export ABC transporter permease subunit FetB n=1 Tax=Clostridium sporogenes TaxID=1509 RepID=A0A7U4JNM2_CLOSG|nr:iron export ABC transporter permease subunit FetB [Clostridium sporogenes]AVP59185.1 iron export ABC transporter permease subunit FetB [Clostridium botulinum]AKC62440.1 TIGR00245 family protein [Clostridium sporogenes]AKJ89705.1 amino acid ABC transporter permease [Clostridium sporogenes]KCZ69750.1 TIGR00245 family protein [Clostridium sporogenes]KOY64854.1 amino acid ABC transporter permease [Clostridium sporogenes]
MQGVVALSIFQFSLIYLLLIIVLIIMKKSKINETKLLLVASLRMSIQLIIVGYILQYMFSNPNPIFTVSFLILMIMFSIERVIKSRKDLNYNFKIAIGVSLTCSGLFVLFFFVTVVVKKSIFNPQYTIPLAGMIIGNAMTGINIGIKSFMDSIGKEKNRINALINLGIEPKDILRPFINNSLETALIPTLNSMLGMGIIFLPGMMTGQILSGTLPITAIMYQIAIMIAICTSVCATVFLSLNLGYKSLYNNRKQFL